MQFLMLAVLLNLSGHIFFHLNDARIETDEIRITDHSEAQTGTLSTHQCSVCQDHQNLPPVAADKAMPLAGGLQSLAVSRENFYQPPPSTDLNSSRAPPQG